MLASLFAIRVLGVLLVAALLGGCMTNPEKSTWLVFQVRHPKSMVVHTNTYIELIQGADAAATSIRSGMVTKSEDADYVTYQLKHLYYSAKRRAMYVGAHDWPNPPVPPEVFILSSLKEPFSSEWGDWHDPDYVDISRYPSWDFSRGVKPRFDTNIPTQHFQLRYRLDDKR
jgi:hypothetical protein